MKAHAGRQLIKDIIARVLGRHHRLSLVAIALVSATYLSVPNNEIPPYYADAEGYLNGAVNILDHGVFSTAPAFDDAVPEPGSYREPGYSVFLAGLMLIDPVFRSVNRKACYGEQLSESCPPRWFRAPQIAQAVLIASSGVLIFFAILLLTGYLPAAWVGAAHIWLNKSAIGDRYYLISEYLAIWLCAFGIWGAVLAYKRRSFWLWLIPAAALTALTLTKAAFLYFAAVVFPICVLAVLWKARDRKRGLLIVLVAATVYVAGVGGWVQRNADHFGKYEITEGRAGIALMHRVVLNEMDLRQSVMAMVYWTRSAGDGLARRWFGRDAVKQFELYAPGQLFQRGERGFGERVRALTESGVPQEVAKDRVLSDLRSTLLHQPVKHLLITIPIFWRGMWGDYWIYLSLPALMLAGWTAVRRRRWIWGLCLAPGAFNLLFYALVSMNIARYQWTAIPSLALATGLAIFCLREIWPRKVAAGAQV